MVNEQADPRTRELRDLRHRVRRLEALLHEAATALEMSCELSQQRKHEIADEFRAVVTGKPA